MVWRVPQQTQALAKIFTMSVCKKSFWLLLPQLSLTLFAIGQSTGQIIPDGSKPVVFLPESVTVPNDEATPTFTADGQTVYLADNNKICVSKKVGDKWSKPVLVSFATSRWNDWDPTLSPDGKRLIFVSDRPWAGMDTSKHDNHLWYAKRLPGDRWSKPEHLPAPVNVSGFNDYGPSVSKQGTVCFCSRNRDGGKGMCGYAVRWAGDHYEKPQRLALNGNEDIYDPYIAPDERYIVFISDTCVFISYRQPGGGWGAGQKLGPQVNDGRSDWGPSISPDGTRLYYMSTKADRTSAILMIQVRIPS
jgi:hypothetical protein